jgi:exoribonuclease R
MAEAMVLVRGARYTAFTDGVPEFATHAAVGQEYAHCTAPLRRLVDRYTTQVCLALCADIPVPEHVLTALPHVPGWMASAEQRASRLEHAGVSLLEALVLRDRVGERFEAVVIDVDDRGGQGTVQLGRPAVRGRCSGDRLELGRRTQVLLAEADPLTRTVRFRQA